MGWFSSKKKKAERPALPPIPSDILAKIRVKGDALRSEADLKASPRPEVIPQSIASETSANDTEGKTEKRKEPPEASPFAEAIEELDIESADAGRPQPVEMPPAELAVPVPDQGGGVVKDVRNEENGERSSGVSEEQRTVSPVQIPVVPIAETPAPAYKREEIEEADLGPVVEPTVPIPERTEPSVTEEPGAKATGSEMAVLNSVPDTGDENDPDAVPGAPANDEELTPSVSIGSVLNALLSRQSGSVAPEQTSRESSQAPSDEAEAGPFLKSVPPEVAQITPSPRTRGGQNIPQNGFGERFGRQIPGMGQVAFTNIARRRNGVTKPVESYQGRHDGPSVIARVISFLFVLSLIAGVLGIGGYFLFLRYREVLFTPVEPVVPILPDPDDTANGAELPSEPVFSLSRPNYLPISIEDVTAEEIRSEIRSVAQRVREAGLEAPIEFLVSDGNNVPIAFSRFAHLAELPLAADIVDLSDEAFSVFVYVDGGAARIGLVVAIKSGVSAADVMKRHEPELPTSLRMLMFEDVNMPRGAMYKSGSYNGTAVRYFNIPGTANLSVDYAIRGNSLYIGTSKDTLRAILDKKK